MLPRCNSGVLLEDWGGCPDATYRQVLQQFLDREDEKTEDREAKERFAIHRACLSRLIERLPGYRPLLTAIQAEYENFVETLERGESEAFFLETKFENLKGEKGTLRNYENRIHDLQKKIGVIERDNARLEEEICEMKDKQEKAEAERLKIALESGEIRNEMTATQRHLLIRHLTLENSTDLNRLKHELTVLESSVQEMQANLKKQFLPKAQKTQLKQHLKARQVVIAPECKMHLIL
jgi:chromosome segregation ATPase